MAKEQVLRFKPARRLEEVDDEHCERRQEREHHPRSCDDSTGRCDSQVGWHFRKGQVWLPRGKHEIDRAAGDVNRYYGLYSIACLRTASTSNLLNSSTSSLVTNWLTSTLVRRPVGWPSTGAVMKSCSRSQPPISCRPYFPDWRGFMTPSAAAKNVLVNAGSVCSCGATFFMMAIAASGFVSANSVAFAMARPKPMI